MTRRNESDDAPQTENISTFKEIQDKCRDHQQQPPSSQGFPVSAVASLKIDV